MSCGGLCIGITTRLFFDKNDEYRFQSCHVLLNHLSKLYDMQHMKPTQKN